MCHECGQESAADDVISCHFLLTSNLVTSNYSTALNCQTNKQRAEQTKQNQKEQFARTRSCAALRAADLDWIVEPEYSLGTFLGRGAGQE